MSKAVTFSLDRHTDAKGYPFRFQEFTPPVYDEGVVQFSKENNTQYFFFVTKTP